MEKKPTGFTLIEMLVGIVIGMIVVAAASVMMVSVLKSQKDVTASARLNQELGAAMAVMSNEIRRAGFRVCDVSADNATEFECPDHNGNGEEDGYIRYNTPTSGRDLEIVGGNCILYRYNTNTDATDDDVEQRGFRLKLNSNFIEMAGTTGAVTCGNDANWVPLTDPAVIDVTGLSFSPAGSRCRNMTLPVSNPAPAIIARYWVIDDTATETACDDNNSDTVNYCTVTVNASPPPVTNTNCTDALKGIVSGDQLFGTRQVIVTLDAALTRDQAVTKRLETSIKVANPRIEIAL